MGEQEWTWNLPTFIGVELEVTAKASISNPNASALETAITLDACVKLVEKNLFSTDLQGTLRAAKIIACLESESDACRLTSGEQFCSKDLFDLVYNNTAIKDMFKIFKLEVPRFPLTLEHDIVTYQCTDSETGQAIIKTLAEPLYSKQDSAAPSQKPVSFLGAVIAFTAAFQWIL